MLKILILLLVLSANVFAKDKKNLHFFNEQGRLVKMYSLRQLKNLFKSESFKTISAYTHREDRYNVFGFRKILTYVYGDPKTWRENYAIKVTGKDGYESLINMEKFFNNDSYLAYEIPGKTTFTGVTAYKDKFIDLSPYYLVWGKSKKGIYSASRYDWVWKIKKIELVKSPPKELFPGDKVSTSITRGYVGFLKTCVTCHRINGAGGSKNIELIRSNSIGKLTDKYLRNYISNPRKLNPKSTMPFFPKNIKGRRQKIIDISNYLRHMHNKNIQSP